MSLQVAALRDVEGVGGGEEVSLVRGAVVVRCQLGVQEGGQGEVGRAFLEALGVEAEQEVQLVLYGLYLNKRTGTCVNLLWCSVSSHVHDSSQRVKHAFCCCYCTFQLFATINTT